MLLTVEVLPCKLCFLTQNFWLCDYKSWQEPCQYGGRERGGERQGSRGRWYRKCSLEAHFALFTRIAKQGMDCQCRGSHDQCSGARWIHIDFCTLRFSSRLFINTSTLSFLNNRIEWRGRCPNRLACLWCHLRLRPDQSGEHEEADTELALLKVKTVQQSPGAWNQMTLHFRRCNFTSLYVIKQSHIYFFF